MRSLLCALLALLLAGATATAAQAAEPAAPRLEQLEVAPSVVDVYATDATVTISATVSDDTGVEDPEVRLVRSDPPGATPFVAMTPLPSLSPGTFSFSAVVTIPRGSAPGVWDVVLAPLTDTATPPNSGPPGPPPGPARSVLVTSIAPDTTPPETTIDGGPPPLTNVPSAAFTFSSSEPEGSTFRCTLDGATASCSSPTRLPGLGDGPHDFAVAATDKAGNADPTPATRTFTVDTQAPETVIDDGPTGSTRSSALRFRFSSPDTEATFTCRLDDEPAAACSSPASYSGLSDGAHVFAVEATDAAGNVDPTEARRAFGVDTSPLPPPAETPPPPTPPVAAAATGADPVAVPSAAPRRVAKADVTGPRILLSALRKRISATRAGGVRFTLGAIREAATGILSLRTAGSRSGMALGSTSFRARPGRRAVLRVLLTQRGRAALKRARRLEVRGTVILRDASGNATIKLFGFTLTAPASGRSR